MKVYHVSKKDLIHLDEPYKFLNGDVYVIETDTELWIWLGSKSFADDKAVGAWGARIAEEKDKDLKIKTILEGEEPPKFKEAFLKAEKSARTIEELNRILELAKKHIGQKTAIGMLGI